MNPINDLKNYENIIFDLGGVLINIDYLKTRKAFEELGVQNFDALFTQFNQNLIFDRFEKGEISPENFYQSLINETGVKISNANFNEAWNAMLLNFPEDRMELLENLTKTHRLFLLSNTNALHIPAFTKIIREEGLLDRFNRVFEKHYYSSEVGMRKPDLEIFDLVINENHLIKEKTLFIDDSPQHIEGAIKAGLNGLHLKPGEYITRIIKTYIDE
jgi:FMN phosphatase YigB (HAD superfamily)